MMTTEELIRKVMQWKCLSQTSLGQTFVFGKFVSTVGRTNVCVWEVRQYCRTWPAKFGKILLRADTRLVFCNKNYWGL